MYSQAEHDKAIFYFDVFRDMCCDIDIQEDADCLVLGNEEEKCSYKLSDVNKVFPQVKTLYIGPNVIDKDITGYGVKHIEVINNKNFVTLDDIVYNKTKTTVVACLAEKTGMVELPEGVTKIEREAFNYCKINSVKFPSTLRLISDNAFADCENLKTIDFGCGLTHVGSSVSWYTFASSGLEKISFPRQVKSIGRGAFYESQLKEITLNEGLEIIEEDSFMMCLGLKSISIPKTVSTIGRCALSYVKNVYAEHFTEDMLTAIILPPAVRSSQSFTVLTIDAREDVGICKTFYVPKHLKHKHINTVKCAIFDFLAGKNDITNRFYMYSSSMDEKQDTALAIYKDCKDEQANAFCECKLSAVEFNHTMTHFEQCCGNGIFSSCGTFSELEIPGYVKGLSKNMFSNSKINKLVLNEGLESIESGALSGYPAHEITLPKSLKYVGNYNFSQATVIHVTGKRVPYGLLKAVTSTYSHRKADGEIIITLIVNGKTYYLPRHMPSKLAARLDELFSFYDVVPEDEIDGLFQKDGMNAIDKSLRQDMMICLYDITKKDCYKQLLKNAKKSIVKRLFENGDEKQLIRFFSFGFFASKSLDNFIKLASEKEMVVLVSYLLEEQKKKSPKKSTKFNI